MAIQVSNHVAEKAVIPSQPSGGRSETGSDPALDVIGTSNVLPRTAIKWNDVGKQLVAKALQNASFRTEFARDQVAAAATLGVEMPIGIAVKVLVDTPETCHIVVPVVSYVDKACENKSDAVNAGLSRYLDGGYQKRVLVLGSD